MKTERKIFIAFILNLLFSIFEFIGGILTGSIAIISDAVHDLGDAAGIGISYIMEKKSKKQANEEYTYGYARYSVLGGLLTTFILICGSIIMIYQAVDRMMSPAAIHYHGMIGLAIVGVCINLCAAYFTRDGESLNQKAVNLHMLEDVLGWIVVLMGAIVMRFTDFLWLDPLMSIGISVFILIHAIKNLKEIIVVFLERAPSHVEVNKLKESIEHINGILDVHDFHVWTLDGQHHLATMHIVTDSESPKLKDHIREKLSIYKICHITIEFEKSSEICEQKQCLLKVHRSHNVLGHCH